MQLVALDEMQTEVRGWESSVERFSHRDSSSLLSGCFVALVVDRRNEWQSSVSYICIYILISDPKIDRRYIELGRASFSPSGAARGRSSRPSTAVGRTCRVGAIIGWIEVSRIQSAVWDDIGDWIRSYVWHACGRCCQ
jgi:hypothetical protein